jgi:hypothetical protein
MFKGVSAYLESLVAQIRAPLLEQPYITLFNQIAFALPHLSRLVNITSGFKLPKVAVSFGSDVVTVTVQHQSLGSSDRSYVRVMCKSLDWQIDCAAQICNALVPGISCVETLALFCHYGQFLPTDLQNGEIDSTTWHDLLRPFVGVQELQIYRGLPEELSRALLLDEVALDPGFLPNLRTIYARDNLFTSFIDARQVVGRPVKFYRCLNNLRPNRVRSYLNSNQLIGFSVH